MNDVVIVAAKRTAIGGFGGAFASVSPVDLAAQSMRAVLSDAGLSGDDLDCYIMGNVLRAGHGQLIPRQAALKAGISESIDGFAVDMVCSSAMMAVINGAALIRSGDAEVVLVGGVESMSQAGFVMSAKGRWGHKYLSKPAAYHDVISIDGLTDPTNGEMMGEETDRLNKTLNFSRSQLDDVALSSHMKAAAARDSGAFDAEITPMVVSKRSGDTTVDTDETIRDATTIEALASLRPAFSDEGLLTAGNSSSLSDGSAALILASRAEAEKRGLPILGTYRAGAWSATEPWRFIEAPVGASTKVLERLSLKPSDIDLFENNEAFATSSLVFQQGLGIDDANLNRNGGSIALGHPIGCSGARLLVTLLHALRHDGGGRGLASLCHGVGGGTAVVLETEG